MFDWQAETELLAARFGLGRMREAVQVLSDAYRAGRPTRAPGLDGELLSAAYLAVRFPATLAVNQLVARHVQQALRQRSGGEFHPESLLDLGAGTGAALLAATGAWPELSLLTALEPLGAFREIGRQLVPQAMWRSAGFDSAGPLTPHDVVWASYSLGEASSWQPVLAKAWVATRQLLVVVEPGTPRGFELVRAVRNWLIGEGADVLAPCPSNGSCPVVADDWCHFSARLNRTALHRRLKGAELGYEDEKFSWVAAWRGALRPGPPRILRHPRIDPGCIGLDLCQAPDRLARKITRGDKSAFKLARKAGWGEVWPVDLAVSARLSKNDG
jgi:ribosomal protein RSM22 (predicted rRNA methylase)